MTEDDFDTEITPDDFDNDITPDDVDNALTTVVSTMVTGYSDGDLILFLKRLNAGSWRSG